MRVCADSTAITGQAQGLTKVQYNRGTCSIQVPPLAPSIGETYDMLMDATKDVSMRFRGMSAEMLHACARTAKCIALLRNLSFFEQSSHIHEFSDSQAGSPWPEKFLDMLGTANKRLFPLPVPGMLN